MALPLMVLNNEHQTFWCFDSIMKTVVKDIRNVNHVFIEIDTPIFSREESLLI